MKYRQYFLIYSFMMCCFVLVLLSSTSYFDDFGKVVLAGKSNKNASDTIEESYFKTIEYFLLENKTPYLNFQADILTLSTNDSKVLGENTRGIVQRSEQLGPVHFQAKALKFNIKMKELELDNNVNLNVDSTELQANRAKIYGNNNLVKLIGSVQTTTNSDSSDEQILITSNEALYNSMNKYFEYQGNVVGNLKRKKVYEESIRFTTDSLGLDKTHNLAELKGSVHLIRDSFNIYANLGKIYLDNYNKKLKYYSFSDDVRLEEKVNSSGRSFSRRAFSEKLEGIMSEKKIILTGLPKVFQEKDVIKGNVIVIRENIETVEVDDANTNIILNEE